MKKTADFNKCYERYREERAALKEKKRLEHEAAEKKNASGEMPALESREGDKEVAEISVAAAEPVVV